MIPLMSQPDNPSFQTPISAAGYVDLIQFYLYDAGTFQFSSFTKSGSTFRDKNFITTQPIVGSTPIGLITLKGGTDFNSSELPVFEGEYFGWYSPTGQIYDITYGGPGFYQDSGDQLLFRPGI